MGRALEEISGRGRAVPGGACGFWGACGAGLSAGMYCSIAAGATPLSGESWSLANQLTSRALAAIAAHGGPRCCKRTTFAVIIAASEWIHDTLGVDVAVHEGFKCGFFAENKQCLGKDCLFSNSHEASMEV